MSKLPITIILWLYHTDLAEEFYQMLKPLESITRVRLCICKSQDNNNAVSLLGKLCNIESIKVFDNVGADIYSFIDELQYLQTPYFVKLHSKKSVWGTNLHCQWRYILLDSLIGDIDILYKNITLLNKSNVGYLSCKPFTYTNYESRSSDQIKHILQIMQYDYGIPNKYKIFTGGNMFAGNTQLFQKSIVPHSNKFKQLLSKETGKVNEYNEGTYCHAFERIFGYLSYLYGYKLAYSAPKLFKIVTPTISNKYLYFRKTYNNNIYCYDQANIFGHIISQSTDEFSVQWLHRHHDSPCTYKKVANNTFINTKYIH